MNIFNETNSVFESQLRELFKPESIDQPALFSILSLIFYNNEKLTDVYDIYKLLGLEDFIKLISLLDGRTIKLPSFSELKEAIIFALCFYYREIEGLSWSEIHEKVPYNFSSLSMSYKARMMNSVLVNQLTAIMKEEPLNELFTDPSVSSTKNS